MREIKDMREAPPPIDAVSTVRNTGWPSSREAQGDGGPIVLSERESRLQGEVEQVEVCEP